MEADRMAPRDGVRHGRPLLASAPRLVSGSSPLPLEAAASVPLRKPALPVCRLSRRRAIARECRARSRDGGSAFGAERLRPRRAARAQPARIRALGARRCRRDRSTCRTTARRPLLWLRPARRIGLREVQALHLVHLDGAEQRGAVDGLDRRKRDRSAHQLGDSLSFDLVEGFEHVDAFGDDEVGEQQLLSGR